jgi:hypothetical protein
MPRGAARAVNAAKRRRAPLRYALTVTAALSVIGGGGRDEGRPGKISTACGASNKGQIEKPPALEHGQYQRMRQRGHPQRRGLRPPTA